jgi:hypothetical protein
MVTRTYTSTAYLAHSSADSGAPAAVLLVVLEIKALFVLANGTCFHTPRANALPVLAIPPDTALVATSAMIVVALPINAHSTTAM